MANRKSWLGRVFLVLLLVVAAGGGYAGWKWMARVTLTEIQIKGLVHAQESEIMNLINVCTGAVMFDINALILEDRIRRHPWIMQASVARLPTGMLDIQVIERHPVAQVLASSGRIEYFVDRNGFRMPLTKESFYPVPILSGLRDPYHPVIPIKDEVLKDILFVLPRLSSQSDALLSEVRRTSKGIEILTTPVGEGGSIPVVLGKRDFEYRFRLLESFWEQEVLLHQNVTYASVDLRFNSQVVTREVMQ